MKARDACRAVGCREPVPPQLLMCRAHWSMVPKKIQNWVWSTYQGGEQRRDEWVEAATEAIRAVAEAEGRPVPPKYERCARNAKGEPVEVLL